MSHPTFTPLRPSVDPVLVVVAHPDDESFGLGAVVEWFTQSGHPVDVLCLTRGEASTLGAVTHLGAIREEELRRAGEILGVRRVTLREYPDGGLARVDPELLLAEVRATLDAIAHRAAEEAAEEDAAEASPTVLVFDPEAGVTGHPDHRAASLAGLQVARERGLTALGWALPLDVATTLNSEFHAGFHGYRTDELPLTVEVHREVQRRAIAAHVSQAVPGSVLWRRLELLGDHEHLRRLT